MRQKELRIALVCYGGISLAVYMHGVTKELWKLLRASREVTGGSEPTTGGTEEVYARLLGHLAREHGIRLRVLADIVSGASAGGINSVFLAQAIHSGQSLEPLTDLWLECADVDVLLDPDARLWSGFLKFWAVPVVRLLLSGPGNAVTASVARETRREVRAKLSRFVRSRWFEAPFGGPGFSRLIFDALGAMRAAPPEPPLLPPEHPLDLFVTTTDFKGHLQPLKLNSPPVVEESEHRLSLGFRSQTPGEPGEDLASPLELVFAARATASFPGAFPALQVKEIDALARERELDWENRSAFLKRVMPEHHRRDELDGVALIDGSVLVNAPFEDAIGVLRNRPALREVDRRFVYIDPHPDTVGGISRTDPRPPGFFSTIFGSLSSIPREQPIRDNLDLLARNSREMAVMRTIVAGMQPEIEEAVEKLFGRTWFLGKPTTGRLEAWRNKAHLAATEQAGYAYNGYANVKIAKVVDSLAVLIHEAVPEFAATPVDTIAMHIGTHLAKLGLDNIIDAKRGGVIEAGVDFFRDHDLPFRIRRLRLLARRMTVDWAHDEDFPEPVREHARAIVHRALGLYLDCGLLASLGEGFAEVAAQAFTDIGGVLDEMAKRRHLVEIDHAVDAHLVEVLLTTPAAMRRKILLTYVGFPFYDTVTLPLLQGEGMTEFDPIKVDRISPDDARSIRSGGAHETLRGVEFYNFGAFFSRAYRENDYLWGRLHGAERMIDLVASAMPVEKTVDPTVIAAFKRDAFLAILDEEEGKLQADPDLIPALRQEVLAKMEEA